jgi:hypothetical protein
VEGKTTRRHTSAEFIAFLTQLLSKTRWTKEIHIVLDNLSAHKTKAVEEFLAQHPNLRFHFTPTYSSWLNQVELWFAKIQPQSTLVQSHQQLADRLVEFRHAEELSVSQGRHGSFSQVSRCKMPTWKASTGDCATNA